MGLTQAAEAIGKRSVKFARGTGGGLSKGARAMNNYSITASRMAIGAGIGGLYGGAFSDNHMTGAFKGAMGGAFMGALAGEGLPALARGMRANKEFMTTAGSYSSSVIAASKMLNTDTGRNAMWATGGMLGGAMFRGKNRDYRRGFNQNRGSHILG